MGKAIILVAVLISGCVYGGSRISSAIDTLQVQQSSARIDARIARDLR